MLGQVIRMGDTSKLLRAREADDAFRSDRGFERPARECQEFCVSGGRSGYVMAVLSP
jgi:hypothetical protein